MKKELWKNIVGYNGDYQISSKGRIRSFKRNTKGVILKLVCSPGTAGYCFSQLSGNGQSYLHKVHRLVAVAFLPKDPKRPYVNHKNSNRSDNRVENLEWVTSSENTRHCLSEGRRKNICGEKHPFAKLTTRDVKKIRSINYQILKQHHAHLAKTFGVGVTQIQKIIRGVEWQHLL